MVQELFRISGKTSYPLFVKQSGSLNLEWICVTPKQLVISAQKQKLSVRAGMVLRKNPNRNFLRSLGVL